MTDKQKLDAVALLLGMNNNVLILPQKRKTAKQIYQDDFNRLMIQVNESEALRLIKKNLQN